jgi:hypothetical protein
MKTLKELEAAYDAAKDKLYASRKSRKLLDAARKVYDEARNEYFDAILAEKNKTNK